VDKQNGALAAIGVAGAVGAILLISKVGATTPPVGGTGSVDMIVSSDGTPVSGATVTLAGQTLTTDAEGTVTFQTAQTGSDTLSVSATGYTTINESIQVESGNTYDIDLVATGGGVGPLPTQGYTGYYGGTYNEYLIVAVNGDDAIDGDGFYVFTDVPPYYSPTTPEIGNGGLRNTSVVAPYLTQAEITQIIANDPLHET
jgi:hypothetical protein